MSKIGGGLLASVQTTGSRRFLERWAVLAVESRRARIRWFFILICSDPGAYKCPLNSSSGQPLVEMLAPGPVFLETLSDRVTHNHGTDRTDRITTSVAPLGSFVGGSTRLLSTAAWRPWREPNYRSITAPESRNNLIVESDGLAQVQLSLVSECRRGPRTEQCDGSAVGVLYALRSKALPTDQDKPSCRVACLCLVSMGKSILQCL